TERGIGHGTDGNAGKAGRIQVVAPSGIATAGPVREDQVDTRHDIGPAAIDSRGLLDTQRRAGARLNDAGQLPASQGGVERALSPAEPRQLVDERRVHAMPDVVARGSAIEFRIPEVLVVVEAGNVVRREVATLSGHTLAQRVVDLP